MDKLLYTFFDKNLISIKSGHRIYLNSKNNKKYTDLTAGYTGHAILGWSNKKILSEIINQAKKITHIDYKYWKDDNRTLLANKILSNNKNNLNRVFFVGSSGAEACEAAIKMSYQIHYDNGKKDKSIIISRNQSYHGCTTQSLSIGDRPNLYFYKKILNKNVRKISEHNFVRYKKKNETMEDYAIRSSKELEDKILKIGPEKVCCFVGETMAGGLVGDVPPANNYWKNIRKICDKYNVHLILDEVWCGTGVSGKNFCIDYDGITPDFVFLSKTLAAGYGALSAVATRQKLFDNTKKRNGQIFYSNTHQGHSLSIAAAFACQKIINNKFFLNSVYKKGQLLRSFLKNEMSNHEFFINIRGRGLRNSFEFYCEDNHLFGNILKKKLMEKYNIIIDSKWHRICFSPALIITKDEIIKNLEIVCKEFKILSRDWSSKYKKKVKFKYF